MNYFKFFLLKENNTAANMLEIIENIKIEFIKSENEMFREN